MSYVICHITVFECYSPTIYLSFYLWHTYNICYIYNILYLSTLISVLFISYSNKCEICGNQSYWGRKAFDRHFQVCHSIGVFIVVSQYNCVYYYDTYRITQHL
jgi:hypothetical protein